MFKLEITTENAMTDCNRCKNKRVGLLLPESIRFDEQGCERCKGRRVFIPSPEDDERWAPRTNLDDVTD